MAQLAAAHPRGTFAARHVLAEGIADISSLVMTRPKRLASLALQVAAVSHLGALSVLEALPGNYTPPFLLAATGAAVALLLFRQRPVATASAIATAPQSPVAPFPVHDTSPEEPALLAEAGLPWSPRELQLEIQSQRLVEIADSATRARRDAQRRSEAWANLMAQVSHDIRTPLNAVIGFSDVMTAEMFGPMGHPRYREYADHIRDSGRALLKSAEDTLALTQLLAQPGSGMSYGSASLAPIAVEAWSVHAAEARERGLDPLIDVCAGTEVLCDKRLLRQILVNLMSEAMARAGAGATIALIARGDDDLVEIELSVKGPLVARKPGEHSLSLGLARALLELQDAFLVEYPAETSVWRAATMLSRATQQDFFVSARDSARAA